MFVQTSIPILCLSSRMTVTSTHFQEEDAYYYTRVVFSRVLKKESRGWCIKEAFCSFYPLSHSSVTSWPFWVETKYNNECIIRLFDTLTTLSRQKTGRLRLQRVKVLQYISSSIIFLVHDILSLQIPHIEQHFNHVVNILSNCCYGSGKLSPVHSFLFDERYIRCILIWFI